MYGPAPRDIATIDDTDNIEVEDSVWYSNSDVESRAPVVELAFDPHPDHALWVQLKELYLMAFNDFISPMAQYTAFLGLVKELYGQRVDNGLGAIDGIWIQTTLAYFPDFTSWVEKKNEIIPSLIHYVVLQ